MSDQKFRVIAKKKVLKGLGKIPVKIQKKFKLLIDDLTENGPVQPNWPNYSKLGKNKFHCHLSYSWVACWEYNEDNELIIEVYYVGSREKAPY